MLVGLRHKFLGSGLSVTGQDKATSPDLTQKCGLYRE